MKRRRGIGLEARYYKTHTAQARWLTYTNITGDFEKQWYLCGGWLPLPEYKDK